MTDPEPARRYKLPTAEEVAQAAEKERDLARAETETARAERNAALERLRVLEEEIAKRR